MTILTRAQLLELYSRFTCEDFRNVIEEILKQYYLSSDSAAIPIDDRYLQRAKKECTTDQLRVLAKYGIQLPEDIQIAPGSIRDERGYIVCERRNVGKFQGKAIYLSSIYDWSLEKAEGELCLVPKTKLI